MCTMSRSSRTPPQQPSPSIPCGRGCSPSSPSRHRPRRWPRGSASPPEGQLPPAHARGARPRRPRRRTRPRRHHRAPPPGDGGELRRVARRAERRRRGPAGRRRPPVGALPRRPRRPRRARGRQPRPQRAVAGRRLPTMSIDTEIRFRNAADRAAFADDLIAAVVELAARYHHDDGRPTVSSSPPTPNPRQDALMTHPHR